MMKYTKRFALAASGFALAFLGGCMLMGPSYTEPQEFDLAIRADALTEVPFELGVFRNLSGSDRRLLYRKTQNQMVADDYNRWLLTPDLLIERHLHTTLTPQEPRVNSGERLLRLSGTVHQFELDLERRQAILSVDYTVRLIADHRPTVSRNLNVTTQRPLSAITGSAAAEAMSGAMGDSITQAREFLIKTNKELLTNQ